MKYEGFDFDEYVNGLIDVLWNIEIGKITVLTGRNGGGKSFIRKFLQQFIEQKVNDGRRQDEYVSEISMDKRIDFYGGINRCCNCDMPDTPTSENTINHIDSLFRNSNKFLVIDEIELGMGEELQIGLCQEINTKIDDAIKRNLGILIITHSRTITQTITHDKFINLDGMTEEEWLNRKLVPLTPSELNEWSSKLSRAINKRLVPRK